MSSDFSIRPIGASAVTTVVQAPSQGPGNTVPTELPASQSVAAAATGTTVRNDPQTVSQEFVSRQAFFDRAAASMVFQVLNSKTNQVVNQYPDEAVLRRRAYFNALDMSKSELPRALPTDRRA